MLVVRIVTTACVLMTTDIYCIFGVKCSYCNRIATMLKIQLFTLIMKGNEMHYFSNLFDKIIYMFRLLADASTTIMTNTYCCVYSVETPDDGQ